MSVIDSKQRLGTDAIVAVALAGGKVTAGFRASLFAAAGRSGQSVNEFVLMAAAEKMKADGAGFDGVFRPGDLISEAGPDPFAGSDHRVTIGDGFGFVTEAEKSAFEAVKPREKSYRDWAISLMRADVIARAAR